MSEEPIDMPADPSADSAKGEPRDVKREDVLRDEAFRLLIAAVRDAGGRVWIKREVLAAVDLDADSLRIIPVSDGVMIQVGNGLGA